MDIKKTMATVLMSTAVLTATAGGYVTNTNQSVGFLRNPARDASIGVDGVYYNPAGVAFMNDGFHLGLNWQMVRQHRDARASYGDLFKWNYANPSQCADGSRVFKGDVNVPIQPAVSLVYNKSKWSYQLSAGFIGGGGECEFTDGVAAFEALVGSSAMTALGANFGGYAFDSYVKGRSYDIGLSFGVAHKVTEQLGVFAGLRGIFALNNYKGHLSDIAFRMADGTILSGAMPDFTLDCDQTGFGIAPVIGVDYRVNDKLNVAMKYEFRTHITTKNDAANSVSFEQLAQSQPAFAGFVDGAENNADLPGMLSVGVQYAPIHALRISAGYHRYFDVDTRQWTKSQLDDTNEFTFGVEYDVTPRLEVSAGGQKTIYDQTDDNVSDLAFNLSSYSLGVGVAYRLTENVKLSAAYFRTFYDDRTKVTPVSSTRYSRDNRVIGIGLELGL